jgi:hypothetical protein
MLAGLESSVEGERGGKRISLTFGEPRVAYRVDPFQVNEIGALAHRLVHCQVVSWGG